MSQLGDEWSTLDGNVLQYRDRVLNEKVDTKRLPYSARVDNLIYHSNLPKIRLSGQMIDLTKPLGEEEKAILRQTIPKSIGESIQKFQLDFKKEKERKTAEARTKYFRETNAGRQKAFDMRFEQYLKDHPEKRFMQSVVDALVKIGDFAIPTLGKIVGLPPAVIDMYKAFAPPGSKFYTKGSVEDKFKRLAVQKIQQKVDEIKAQVLKGQLGMVGQQLGGTVGQEYAEKIVNVLNDPSVKQLLKEPAVQDIAKSTKEAISRTNIIGNVPFKLGM